MRTAERTRGKKFFACPIEKMSTLPPDRHNVIVKKIVQQLHLEVQRAGGSSDDVLIVVESMIVGVVSALVMEHGRQGALAALFAGVTMRIEKYARTHRPH